MHAHTFPRFFLVPLMSALIAAGLLTSPVAADTTTWSDTGSGEDIFVHACPEFDVTTSYTADRTFKVVSNSSGDQVVERVSISFAGALANNATGQSLPYDGGFHRYSDYHSNKVTITDLKLRFDIGTAGQLSVAVDRVELDLVPDPAAVVKTFAPTALQTALCSVLGGVLQPHVALYEERMFSDPLADRSVASYEERMFSGPSSDQSVASYEERTFSAPATDVHTENAALLQPANKADSDMTSWTELDPCDTSPPGQGC
jgi:hypothetical protein